MRDYLAENSKKASFLHKPSLLRGHLLQFLGSGANGAVDPRVQHNEHEERNDSSEEKHCDHGDLQEIDIDHALVISRGFYYSYKLF